MRILVKVNGYVLFESGFYFPIKAVNKLCDPSFLIIVLTITDEDVVFVTWDD